MRVRFFAAALLTFALSGVYAFANLVQFGAAGGGGGGTCCTRVGSVLYGENTSGSTFASIATSSTMNLASGNLVVAVCRNDTSNTTTVTVSDTAGNTYTDIGVSSTMASTDRLKMFYAKNTTSNASNTVNCNYSPNAAYVSVSAAQYSGADTSAPLDQTATGTDTSGTANSITSGTFTTTVTNELLAAGFTANTTSDTFNALGGYTLQTTATNMQGFEDKLVTSIQTNATASAGSVSGHSWEMVVGTFK